MPWDLPSVVVDELDVNLDTEGPWELSEIPPSGVINICSSLPWAFFLIHKKCVQFSINRLPSDWGRMSNGVTSLEHSQ